MKRKRVRPLAICVFRNGDRILVAEGYDEIKRQTFYRPLGGGIEFGEYSWDTIAREIREELGVEVADVRYLGTMENIFVFNGQKGHEIVLIYDGAFVDGSLYQKETLTGVEDDGVSLVTAIWKSLDDFDREHAPLYPDGLLELLKT